MLCCRYSQLYMPHMCKRIFRFKLQPSSYWQNIKLSRNCPKFHIFTWIVIFQVYLQLFDQLLYPCKFYGRDMSGIFCFFIFASCEPLKSRWTIKEEAQKETRQIQNDMSGCLKSTLIILLEKKSLCPERIQSWNIPEISYWLKYVWDTHSVFSWTSNGLLEHWDMTTSVWLFRLKWMAQIYCLSCTIFNVLTIQWNRRALFWIGTRRNRNRSFQADSLVFLIPKKHHFK